MSVKLLMVWIEDTATAVMCDLTKPFHGVCSDVLIHKFQFYLARAVEVDLFKSYFSNRRRFVTYGGKVFTVLSVKNGVPQGSVLGPVSFPVYINDLSHAIVDCCVLFADDTTILSTTVLTVFIGY